MKPYELAIWALSRKGRYTGEDKILFGGRGLKARKVLTELPVTRNTYCGEFFG